MFKDGIGMEEHGIDYTAATAIAAAAAIATAGTLAAAACSTTGRRVATIAAYTPCAAHRS